MPMRQIKFTGAMKQRAETSPSPRPCIKRQTTEPHVGAKQLAKLARKAAQQS